MDAQFTGDFERIGHRTCQSICDAVGERLQQIMRPQPGLPPRLRKLIDEMGRCDSEPR
jgi:hypothetical protein